jgi:hypothetical protein
LLPLCRSGQPVTVCFGAQSVDAIGGEAVHQEVVHRAALCFTAWGAPCLMGTMALNGWATHQENSLDLVDRPFICR